MVQYSVQPRNQIFIKGYWFLSFAKNMGSNIGKKYKWKREASGDLIGNEIADRIKKVSKTLETINY